MPQLQNLVLKDRAATPVNHTFTPLDIVDGVGAVIESSGIPIGNNRATVSQKRTAAGKYKPEFRLEMPVVQTQTVNGVSIPVVVRTAYAQITFTFDPTSTTQERNDMVGMVQEALSVSSTLVNDTVVKLQGVY